MISDIPIVYPNREHILTGVSCWCKPNIEHLDNGEDLVTHNDISEFFEQDEPKPISNTEH